MTPSIRPATCNDLAAVEEVVRAAYTRYIARLGRKPGPMLDDYGASIGAGRVHVLEFDGVVRGILVLVPEDGTMLLDNLAVAPEAQGKGFGRLMLAFAEQAAIDADFDCIKLYTNEAMKENIALYCRAGYVETHRATKRGLRRVYMRKRLGGSSPLLA